MTNVKRVLTPAQKGRRREKRRERRRRRGQAQGLSPVPVPQAVNNRMNRNIKLRKGPTVVSRMNGGVSCLKYSELWKPVASGVTNLLFTPGKSGLNKLDIMGLNWDQYVLRKASIFYKTSSATTVGGHLLMGIDYSVSTLAATINDVASLDPRVDGPVWNNLNLVVDSKQAMTKDIYYTNRAEGENTAFALSVFSDVASSGLIWCDYEVDFMSPHNSKPSDGVVLASSQSVLEQAPLNIFAIGEPNSTLGNGKITGAQQVVRTSTNTVTTNFRIESTSDVGDSYAISSTGAEAVSGNGANVVVSFRDAVTGVTLSSDIVKQVSASAANGFFSVLWQFIKPYVRQVLIHVVETVTAGNSDLPVDEVTHIVTDIPPTGLVIAKPLQTGIGFSCMSVASVGSGTFNTSIDAAPPMYPLGSTIAAASNVGTYTVATGTIPLFPGATIVLAVDLVTSSFTIDPSGSTWAAIAQLNSGGNSTTYVLTVFVTPPTNTVIGTLVITSGGSPTTVVGVTATLAGSAEGVIGGYPGPQIPIG